MKTRRKGKNFGFKGMVLFVAGIAVTLLFKSGLEYTSTNMFCESCHVHPQASSSWRLGSHFDNSAGVVVNCVDCHLPPAGPAYLAAKTSTGLRDVYGLVFKDERDFDWELKSTRAAAAGHVYKASCLKCHRNLFPRGLSKKGGEAHLYYDQNQSELRCINCHLEVGHFHKKKSGPVAVVAEVSSSELYARPARVESFVNFRETIPGSHVDFDMIAIPGGTFLMGSPKDEFGRRPDEGPRKELTVKPFWMGRLEVSWIEYELFLKENGVEGRSEDQSTSIGNSDIDAVTGPTPPYGNPDQGWGKGRRPAITMTYFAAQRYCQWLAQKTGKPYRLPTEAEWEYACRAGTQTPYFFEADPGDISQNRFWNRLFGADTSRIGRYAVFAANSRGRTWGPQRVKANPFGLLHMAGNVREFCSDIYRADAHAGSSQAPVGPAAGPGEHVVRGGSFKSPAEDLRSAARDHTRHDAWLVTDPQIPKSLWWYSDCNDVGFRVVCEYNSSENK